MKIFSRVYQLWIAGGAVSGLIAIIVLFVARDALVNAYGTLIIDRPVHYKELAKPYNQIHRKGEFLARDGSIRFYLWGVDT
jgi:hypothetical protein